MMAKKNYTKAERNAFVQGKIVGYRIANKKKTFSRVKGGTTKKPSKKR